MMRTLRRLCSGLPDHFPAVLLVALAFTGFVAVDQAHWWRLKPDYAFGWLVPCFVAYVVHERWGRLRDIMASVDPAGKSRGLGRLLPVVAGLVLTGGLFAFLFGAVYRAGAGSSQPGSLALAIGLAGLIPGMLYFAAPAGTVGAKGMQWTLRRDARLRVVALFWFPAAIWLLSAPLLTAVENTISLMLLRRVVAFVSTLFGLLGLPLVREGNVLILPQGQVGVADACSGIRSLMGCLFAGTFLAAVFLDRFWKKIVLVACALALAFFTNLLRSLFLTSWAYRYGSQAIEGTLHDATGYAVLGLTSLLLFCLLPLFRQENWRRWLGLAHRKPRINSDDTPPAAIAASKSQP